METYKAILIIFLFSMLVSSIGLAFQLYSLFRGERIKDAISLLRENYPFMTVEDAEKIFGFVGGYYKWRYLTLGMLFTNVLPAIVSFRALKRMWLG